MPEEGTDAMTPPPTAPADPFLDPLTRNRTPAGYVLAALAVAFLAAGGYCFYKAFAETPAAEKTADETLKPDLKDDGKDAGTKLQRPYANEYLLGGIVGVICALACGGAGGWLIGSLPTAGNSVDRLADRLLIFIVGAALGVALMILGFVLFYLWFGELAKWLGQVEKAEPLKPLLAILAFLLGAGLLFAGVQPLRAEERNDVRLRRIVYGANFFLTTLLLIVGLIFVNVLVTLKLPSRLDTTESGFYTLSPNTKDYLGRLDKDVVIYTMIPENREGTDVMRVLQAFREVNPKSVKVKDLSLTLDKNEIASLKAKFPTADLADASGRGNYGLIVALGPDEKRYQFIQYDELLGRESTQRGQPPGRRTLQCEPRLIREILFLTENKQKPVIYFTQGAGEITIDAPPGADRPPNFRSGEFLKQGLIADYCDVKPLTFDALAIDPQVPNDATVVCIADPTAKMSENAVRALTRYMNTPRPDGTKGKLLVIAAAHNDPAQPRTLLKLGIEPLLGEYGVAPQDRVAYFQPQDQLPPDVVLAGVMGNLVDQGNSIALAFAKSPIIAISVRPLDLPTGQSKYKVQPLFGSLPDRISWLENAPAGNPMIAYQSLRAAVESRRTDIIKEKDAKQNSTRLVAAISSDPEGNTGRVVMIGFGGFEDNDAVAKGGYTVPSELISASVNWLRDRPAVANEGAKPYGVYTPNPKWDWSRGFTLPVTLVILGISALGLGLWVLRRR